MKSLTIRLSDAQAKRLERRAAARGFKDASAYAASVLARLGDLSDDEDFGAPEHLTVRSREDLEAKLLEGLDSGRATEMTAADWSDMREEVRRRAAAARRSARAS